MGGEKPTKSPLYQPITPNVAKILSHEGELEGLEYCFLGCGRCPLCPFTLFSWFLCYRRAWGWQEEGVAEDCHVFLLTNLAYILNGVCHDPITTCGSCSFPRMSSGEVHFLHQNSFVIPQEHHQEPGTFQAQQVPSVD